MFFARDNHVFEIVGVYRGVRERFKRDSFPRSHASMGIRLSGKSEFFYDGERKTATTNQLIYIPATLQYSQRSVDEEFISVCFIEHDEVCRKMELLELPKESKIQDMLIELHDAWVRREGGYKLKCQAMLYELLACAYNLSGGQEQPKSRLFELIRPALERIYAGYKTEELSIVSLAGLCYISPTYFRRVFKEVFGVSPISFIKALRIDSAVALLKSGDFSVSDVALAVGFTDAKYFSREFKKVKGVSPASYCKL